MSLEETLVTVTAGGVVLNKQGHVLVVSQRGKSWSLPKGHIDPGEEPLHAAIREIMEESGITDLQLIGSLGAYGRYKIGFNGADDKREWKIIFFFLFRTSQDELNPQDSNHPQACWVHPDEVEALLTHPKDKDFYKNIRPQV